MYKEDVRPAFFYQNNFYFLSCKMKKQYQDNHAPNRGKYASFYKITEWKFN